MTSLSVCFGQASWEFYRSGKYEDSIALAEQATSDAFNSDESWVVLKAKSELAIGRFTEAAKTIESGLDRYTTSIRIRLIAVQVAKLNNRPDSAREISDEIDELWRRSSWRYKGPQNQIAIAAHKLNQGVDAKQVLSEFLTPVQKNNPQLAAIHLAIGNLAKQKHDDPFAAESFARAVELDPKDPDAYFGLATAFLSSNSERATAGLQSALDLNPRHQPSLLLQIDQSISRENYEQANQQIEAVLEINPHNADAWAYRAAVANLQNKPKLEGEYRDQALKHGSGNPNVDYLIGKKLSQKYRFTESLKYQRRSLVYDPKFLPAKMQLAHDLLRAGNELEGWKVADEVFAADPYSVVAFNLVTLRDNIAKFETIESDGFVIRMSRAESAIYGQHVLELLRDAKRTLTEKYDVELQTPIFIEIFPKQSDFAIRTFGLPGGAGFLGVCFGRVVTMNSPAAQGATLTNWKSVLWHEFCHVVTLQKTKNRMPRWLSEGISVYEEGLKNSAWGQTMNPRYRKMLLGDDLTPISKLSGAFLSPKSPAHLDLAYFESSLAVKYMIDEYGMEALQNVLKELAFGVPINDSLRRHIAPLNELDHKFTTHVRELCTSFASDADLTTPEISPQPELKEWEALAAAEPSNRFHLLGLATAQTEASDWSASNKTLEKLLAIYPMTDGAEPALQLMAKNFRELKQTDRELETLESLMKISSSDVAACSRILNIVSQAEDWKKTREYAKLLLGINPLIKSPHRYLAMASEKLEDDANLVQALTSLVTMEPLDPAEEHYRLAAALHRQGQLESAKRQTLIALEFAPRFQKAHQLLLDIVKPDQPTTDTEKISDDAKAGDQ
jgi:tetratricopeptide (TPR) repeat protein